MNIIKSFHRFGRVFARTTQPMSSSSGYARGNAIKPKEDSRGEPDLITQSIRSATNPQQIFHIVQDQQRALNLPQILQSLKAIFTLQKSGNSHLKADDILQHPDFELLCNRLKYKCRSIEFNDIVEVIKTLSYLGVPVNSEIFNTFLTLLRKEINNASLMHIVFLDYLFRKIDRSNSPLVDALRMSFPILFELNLDNQIDHDNVPQLVDLLSFICRNKVNKKSVMAVVNALLLHGEGFDYLTAKKIAWSLSDSNLNFTTVQQEKLFHNAMNCLTREKEKLAIDQLETVVIKMSKKYTKNPNFLHEGFLNAIATLLIREEADFEMCCYFLKGFNKMSFINLPLLHFTLSQFYKNPAVLSECRPAVLLSLVGALSNAGYSNFSPEDRAVFTTSINQNALFDSEITGFPWTKLACELASIDVLNHRLITRLFSDEFLDEYMARKSTIDYLQLLNIYQYCSLFCQAEIQTWPSENHLNGAKEVILNRQSFAVKKSLEYAFGGQEYIATKVLTKFLHLIDHILQFNENNDICKLSQVIPNEDGFINLEDIQTSDHVKTVAVMVFPKTYYASNLKTVRGIFDLQIRTLRQMNLVPVVVDLVLWQSLPDQEKIPFLQREIKSHL